MYGPQMHGIQRGTQAFPQLIYQMGNKFPQGHCYPRSYSKYKPRKGDRMIH